MNRLLAMTLTMLAGCWDPHAALGQGTPAAPERNVRQARAGDQVTVLAMDVEELNGRTFRIDERGVLDLPLVGIIPAVGQTAVQIQQAVAEKLRAYVRNPQISITLTPLQADTAFLVGAFKAPGVYSLTRPQRLSEVLVSVGGLSPVASRRLKVTRRLEEGTFDLPAKVENRAAGTVSVEVSVNRLMELENPADDFLIRPNDTITALRAEIAVFISGAVGRPGSYPLEERDSMTVVQLLAMAGGLAPDAVPQKAVVLRPVLDTARRAEVPLNLANVMSGRAADFPLTANDVLVVPRKAGLKANLGRMAYVAIPVVITTALVSVLR